jgi:hypothetical protein
VNMLYRYVISKSILYATWMLLLIGFGWSLYNEQWINSGLAGITFILTLVLIFFQKKDTIYISQSFVSATALFIYGSIFLGEANKFYEKYWWWDMFLHSMSAIGFGLVGVIFLLLAFGKSKNQGSPFIFAAFSFCFAVAIGVLWEIFEFSTDQILGTDMQKSGLTDTMTDLIIDCIGAAIAALAGYLYLINFKYNIF